MFGKYCRIQTTYTRNLFFYLSLWVHEAILTNTNQKKQWIIKIHRANVAWVIILLSIPRLHLFNCFVEFTSFYFDPPNSVIKDNFTCSFLLIFIKKNWGIQVLEILVDTLAARYRNPWFECRPLLHYCTFCSYSLTVILEYFYSYVSLQFYAYIFKLLFTPQNHCYF